MADEIYNGPSEHNHGTNRKTTAMVKEGSGRQRIMVKMNVLKILSPLYM
jgi:hypothetical protein